MSKKMNTKENWLLNRKRFKKNQELKFPKMINPYYKINAKKIPCPI